METFIVTAVMGTWKVAVTFWIRTKMLKRFEYAGKLSELHLYPVKACGSTRVKKAFCSVKGLTVGSISDRNIMVVEIIDDIGQYRLMRHFPALSLIRADFDDNNHITLTAPDMEPLTLPEISNKDCRRIKCQVHRDKVTGRDYGHHAANWLCRYLKSENMRLVHFCDSNYRTSGDITRPWTTQATKDDLIAFTYMSGYLLANQKSLEDLNKRMDKPVSIVNFRPNIVIDAEKAFDEDDWLQLRIGEHVLMRCQDYCRRCVITSINPDTAKKDPDIEPLTTLKKFRKMPGYGDVPCFGVYAGVDVEGSISVGDPVFVLRK